MTNAFLFVGLLHDTFVACCLVFVQKIQKSICFFDCHVGWVLRRVVHCMSKHESPILIESEKKKCTWSIFNCSDGVRASSNINPSISTSDISLCFCVHPDILFEWCSDHGHSSHSAKFNMSTPWEVCSKPCKKDFFVFTVSTEEKNTVEKWADSSEEIFALSKQTLPRPASSLFPSIHQSFLPSFSLSFFGSSTIKRFFFWNSQYVVSHFLLSFSQKITMCCVCGRDR